MASTDDILYQQTANEPASCKSETTSDGLELRLNNIHGYAAKPGQLEAIRCLLEGRDVLLSAKMGYGKSMILYSQSALKPDTISLLIMPLNTLEVDQANAIKKMHAEVSPCILNAETMKDNAELLSRIKLGMHTHVLTSPEFALSNESVQEVFQTPGFRDCLVLIAIDEVHLVEDWASWRPDYGRLKELQSILPHSVPFFATLATVGDKLAKKLIVNLRLNANVKILKESIDREDLFFNVRMLHVASTTSFEDLRFLTTVIGSLPKVIIYGDSIALLIRIKETLTKFYREAGGDITRARRAIRCYNGPMSEAEKTSIYENFREVNSEIRILCATDAMGLRMNIVDIDIVIQ